MWIETMLENLRDSLQIVALLLFALIGLNMLLNRLTKEKSDSAIYRQIAMIVALLVAAFLLVVLLPMDESLRGQILSLLGILISAALALSATTFLGNALAGILLRSVNSFKIGDFIYVQDQFGRVCERGLFHVEIQTEDRDLITLPNLYVTNNPVKVTRDSGAIVWSEVSLGYDVSRSRIEELLPQAAEKAGLDAPFVHIKQLGDFSVVYRVNGMLTDVKQLLSARSRLNGAILDVMHEAGIEIVSPNFMNQRIVTDREFISRPAREKTKPTETRDPEEIIFDKAEKAATLEEQKSCLAEVDQRIEALKSKRGEAGADMKESITRMIDRLKRQKEQLNLKISESKKSMDEEKGT